MRRLACLSAFLLFTNPAVAWQISASAGDSLGNSANTGNIMSVPATPVSSGVQTADLLPAAYAQVDLINGTLKAYAEDPAGGANGSSAFGNATVARYDFVNNSTTTYNIASGALGMAIAGSHSISGAPNALGSQTAFVQYTSILDWRSTSSGITITQNVLSSRRTNSWENGVNTGTTSQDLTALGNAFTAQFDVADYVAFSSIPAFTWSPGEIMTLRAQLVVMVSTTDSGFAVYGDAMNTAALDFVLPPGVVLTDAGLMTRQDANWLRTPEVPLPASGWLLISALAALIYSKRKD